MNSELDQNTIDNIIRFIETDSRIQAAVIIGSQARKTLIADEYSDIDIIMVADNTEDFIGTDSWLTEIGSFHISFVEPTFFGAKEMRVLFDNGTDADFIVLNAKQAEEMKISSVDAFFVKGYRIIKNANGIFDWLNAAKFMPKSREPLSQTVFLNMVNDFYFHYVWTVKKLKRGEVYTAKSCLDEYMKRLLLMFIEADALIRNPHLDVWYGGRFIERWADADTLDLLSAGFAHYDKTDMISALYATMELFSSLADRIAKSYGFTPFPEVKKTADGIVKHLLAVEG
jgi:aminoglycoside 6-adenylyltransferase